MIKVLVSPLVAVAVAVAVERKMGITGVPFGRTEVSGRDNPVKPEEAKKLNRPRIPTLNQIFKRCVLFLDLGALGDCKLCLSKIFGFAVWRHLRVPLHASY